ncbi:hypothetical protein [Bradyrhizobium sp. SRS-191]|uniref:hypothetical protein n=1 Tax=Bradyrhizobium sp. SRS-191 TaxID=2962606 RepID=UPI00211DAFDD|nr:hypothetical protein [Bradyrhizobium sp. SRS-191]
MSKMHAAVTFLGVLLSVPAAFAQAAPNAAADMAPVECTIKDNVEDAGCRARLKGLFARKADTLTLMLEGGKTKVYRGNKAACDGDDVEKCVVYKLQHYFPAIESFVVSKSFYECGEYQLVSRRSGHVTVMSEVPQLSPSGHYLLSIDISDACERKYDIAIWSAQSDPPKLEFRYKAKQYENWELVSWAEDGRLKLRAEVNTDKGAYDQEAELVREGNGWKLMPGRRIERSK